jgi:hypothetical protein
LCGALDELAKTFEFPARFRATCIDGAAIQGDSLAYIGGRPLCGPIGG